MRLTLDLASLESMVANDRAAVVAEVVETLVAVNRLYFAKHGVVGLYASGVKYAESGGWKDIPACLRDGVADCKSLAAWRLAELREADKKATLHVQHFNLEGADRLHLLVWVDGKYEDPSKKLGMR